MRGRPRRIGEHMWVLMVRAKDKAGEVCKFIQHIGAKTKKEAEEWFNKEIRPLYKEILKLDILLSTEETERKANKWLWG